MNLVNNKIRILGNQQRWYEKYRYKSKAGIFANTVGKKINKQQFSQLEESICSVVQCIGLEAIVNILVLLLCMRRYLQVREGYSKVSQKRNNFLGFSLFFFYCFHRN